MTNQELKQLEKLFKRFVKEYNISYTKRIGDLECEITYKRVTTEQILDKEEKEYLSAVIKPFKKQIRCITKRNGFTYIINDEQYIFIDFYNGKCMSLPLFKKGTMYHNMIAEKEYTLKELGLD